MRSTRRSLEAGAAALAPGLAGLVFGFNHLGHQADGIGVQARDRRAMEGFAAQQQGFPQAQVIDPGWITASGQPGEIGGIAAGAPGQGEMEALLQGRCEPGEIAHVLRIGCDAVLAAQVGADAHQLQIGHGQDLLSHRFQVCRQDSLPQIAEFHHQQHPVASTLLLRCGGQGVEHAEVCVATDRGTGHHPIHLAEHRRAHQQQRHGDAAAHQGFDGFNARFADGAHTCAQPGVHDFNHSERGLAHAGHRNALAGQSLHQGSGVVMQFLQVDLEARGTQRASGCRTPLSSGKARTTMATRFAAGRLMASVTGMESSAS